MTLNDFAAFFVVGCPYDFPVEVKVGSGKRIKQYIPDYMTVAH